MTTIHTGSPMISENDLAEDGPAQQQDEIEILEFTSEVYPDRRRVKVEFLLSAFLVNPNASLTLISPAGEVLASVNIVNIFSQANEITLHIPASRNHPGEYRIEMELFQILEADNPESGQDAITLKTIPLRSKAIQFFLS